jgi:nucleoid-associated protein YgaU
MAAVGSLVLIWIFVYWAWSPHGPGQTVRIETARAGVPGDESEGPAAGRDPLDPELIEQGRRELAELLRGGAGTPGAVTSSPEGRAAGAAQPVGATGGAAPVKVPSGTEPPAFREYTIRAGDTFEKIAQREYGSRARARSVAQANPLRDPRRLKPGDVIRLPIDPDNVQGRRAGGAAPTPGTPSATPQEARPGSTQDPSGDATVAYVVKRGDSLSSIAKAYYGSEAFSEFIFESNRDVLRSPERLSIGDTLRLPPVPPG